MTYKLVAAVVHHDLGQQGGHYSSYFVDHAQDKWFLANDDQVCTWQNVLLSSSCKTNHNRSCK